MHGAMTDLQVWSRVLTDLQLEDWRSCAADSRGNIIDWSNAVLESQGLDIIELNKKEVCSTREEKVETQSFGIKRSFQNTTKFCKNFGGEMAVARDEETFKAMLGKYKIV